MARLRMRRSTRKPGAADDAARGLPHRQLARKCACSGLACGGGGRHLGSLIMTRMACSQVHSEPHFTDASSSLNASLASSCAGHARTRASGAGCVLTAAR